MAISKNDLIYIFDISEGEADKLIERKPFVLDADINNITDNIKTLKVFGATIDDIRTLVINHGTFPFLDSKENAKRLEFVQDKFGINPDEIIKFVHLNDRTFIENAHNYLERINAAKEKLNFTDSTIKQLMLTSPFLSYTSFTEDLELKNNILKSFGLDLNKIAEKGSTSIINNNHALIEFKLKLALLNHLNLNTYASGLYKVGPDKIYARMKGVENGDYYVSNVYESERFFQTDTGFSTETLLKKYPLTLEAQNEIEEKFAKEYPEVVTKLLQIKAQAKCTIAAKSSELLAEDELKNKNKIRLYNLFKHFGLTEEEIENSIFRNYDLYNTTTDEILNRIEFLKNSYNITKPEYIRGMMKSNAGILSIPEQQLLLTTKYLEDVYGATYGDIRHILLHGWSITSSTPTDLHYYDKALRQICGFTQNDVAHFILDTSSACLIDPYAINAKIKLLNEFNINLEDLKNEYFDKKDQGTKSFRILGSSYNSIETKLKLALLAGIEPKEYINSTIGYKSMKFMQRFLYSERTGLNFNLLAPSTELVENYGISDDEISEKLASYSKLDLEYYIDYVFEEKFPEINEKLNKLRQEFKNNPLVGETAYNKQKEQNAISDDNLFNAIDATDRDISTIKRLKRVFNLSNEQILSLYNDCQDTFKNNPEKGLQNLATLTIMGLTVEEIVERPLILNQDPTKLEIKVAVAALSGRNNHSFLTTYYRHNEEKVLARYSYLRGLHADPKYIYATEEQFKKFAGIETSLAAQMFPLTQKRYGNLMKAYEELKEVQNNASQSK